MCRYNKYIKKYTTSETCKICGCFCFYGPGLVCTGKEKPFFSVHYLPPKRKRRDTWFGGTVNTVRNYYILNKSNGFCAELTH